MSAITERRDMGMYEVPLSMSGFWDGDYVSHLPYVCIMLVLRAVFNKLVRNGSPRGHNVF